MGKDKETRQRKQNPIAKDLPNFFRKDLVFRCGEYINPLQMGRTHVILFNDGNF